MIINSRTDLDNAPSDLRDRFMEGLAAGINHWDWQNGEWVLVQETATIERFGFTLTDFPDAPVPEMSTHNPDDQATEQFEEEIRSQRNDLLAQTDYLVMPDYPLSDSERVSIEQYRQALRDISEQSGFPHNVEWPTKE